MKSILKYLIAVRNRIFKKNTPILICIKPEEMNEWQKTDVVINLPNCPFITLTQSKISNLWYHDEIDMLFCLTSRGFKSIKGNKKILFKYGLERSHIVKTENIDELLQMNLIREIKYLKDNPL